MALQKVESHGRETYHNKDRKNKMKIEIKINGKYRSIKVYEGMRLVQCEICEGIYDYNDEPREVMQGSTHICSECWE